VEIWYTGVDPFPEAVRPATYEYYASEAASSRRSFLVQVGAAVVHNGTLGRAGTSSYPVPELDRLLQEAASG
jgi:hypothetical protein